MSHTNMPVSIIIYYHSFFSRICRRALYFLIKKEIGVVYSMSYLTMLATT